MILPDVNILISAYRNDVRDHLRFRVWIEELLNGDSSFGISTLVLSALLRIVTNPRIFSPPSEFSDVMIFVNQILNNPNCVVIGPGPRHWDIFVDLCRVADARGNLVPDAYLAALAIESGSEWITVDGDFARFPGLRWRRPF